MRTAMRVVVAALFAAACSGDADPTGPEGPTGDFTWVAAGVPHTCAVTASGSVHCWGGIGDLTLGDDVTGEPCGESGADRCSARAVGVATDVRFRLVSAGRIHACGLDKNGSAYCWGSNTLAQLGAAGLEEDCRRGSGRRCATLPVAVHGGHAFETIDVGLAHSCALARTGVAYCWGFNQFGPAGETADPDCWTNCIRFPTAVSTVLHFASVSAGGTHSCGITLDGTAYCWGRNTFGALGRGNLDQSADGRPAPVAGGLRFADIAAGGLHSCALTPEGRAYCWGSNLVGQLGTAEAPDVCNHTFCSASPLAVTAGPLRFSAITLGASHSCALTTDGAAFCWGYNRYGQLGTGSELDSIEPAPVTGGHRFAVLSAGDAHTCGVTVAGALFCWGSNEYGQSGTGSVGGNGFVPVRVALLD